MDLDILIKSIKLQNITKIGTSKNRDFVVARIGFRLISPVLASHTPPPLPSVLFFYLYPAHSNQYSINFALHTNQSTLCSLHVTPSTMSLKRSNSSSHPPIDATNAKPAKKIKKGTTIVLPDDAWNTLCLSLIAKLSQPSRPIARQLVLLLCSGTSRTAASRSCQRRSVTTLSSRRGTATTCTFRTSSLHPVSPISPHPVSPISPRT